MKIIQSEDELAEEIKKIKARNNGRIPEGIKKVILPFSKIKEENHGYTYSHRIINYKGELLNIKSSCLLSRVGTVFRAWVEENLGFNATINTSVPDSLKYEAQTYIQLNNNKFPTLISRQNVLPEDITNGTVITRRLENVENLTDRVKRVNSLEPIEEAVNLLRKLNLEQEIIFVDSHLENYMYKSDGELLAYDFNLIPNKEVSFNTLIANDLLTLYLSSIKHSKFSPENIAKSIIQTYNPDNQIRIKIELLIKRRSDFGFDSSTFKYFREKFIYLPQFNMKEKEAQSHQEILLKCL